MADEDDEDGQNIRVFLGPLVGCRLVDITQQDDEEFAENHETRIYLHFDSGVTLSFPIGVEGFNVENIDDHDSETG